MFLRNLGLGTALAGALLSAPALAENGRVASPADVDDVKKILRLSEIDKFNLFELRRSFERGNAVHPESAVDVDTYLAFATLDAIDEHVAPVLSNYLARDYAKKLIAALQTPVGKLCMRIDGVQIESGFDAATKEFRKLSPVQQRELTMFRDSNTYKSLINAQNNAVSDAQAMFMEWTSRVSQDKVTQAHRELAEAMEAELRNESDDREDAAPDALPDHIKRTGMLSFDRVELASLDLLRKSVKLSRTFERNLNSIDVNRVFKVENLISREGLEAGNLAILAMENLFDAHEKEIDALSAQYDQTIRNIPMTEESRQETMKRGAAETAQIFDLQLRHSEKVRTVLELEKQLLAFCESRLGKIKLKDGTAMLDSHADVISYNTLLAKINQGEEEIRQVEKEDFERRKQLVEELRRE